MENAKKQASGKKKPPPCKVSKYSTEQEIKRERKKPTRYSPDPVKISKRTAGLPKNSVLTSSKNSQVHCFL